MRLKLNINIWGILSLIIVSLIIIPNLNIIVNLFNKPNDNWYHIKEYMLKEYILNTLVIITVTGVLAIVIGTSLAWIISVYDFPLRKFFKWSLILPLAIPPYIGAYTYNGILNYTGVIQTFLRNTLDIKVNQKYFDMMSIEGAIFIFTLFLFPYVYTITRAFLEKQSAALIENARLLGRNSTEIFISVILPISRTAIIGGVSLVILEVLNDYGVVSYFGIQTFSTAIFKTWFAMGDIDSAIKLASILMFLVFAILILEKVLRGRKKYSYTTTKVRPLSLIKLKGIKGWLAFTYSFVIFSLGFLIPVAQLFQWSLLTYSKILSTKFIGFILNSLFVAFVAASIIIIVALIVANFNRMTDGLSSQFYSKATAIGYSIPGAVIAIGVIVLFINVDTRMYWLYKIINPESKVLFLSSTLVMLIFAYVIRFVAIGYNSIESGFDKVGKKFFEASRTLGLSITQTFFKVDMKMISPAIISGFILVFVDILKELPLTLILRPFNFDTLATKAFEYANDEMIHEAAISSFLIIIISTASIYFFHKVLEKGDE